MAKANQVQIDVAAPRRVLWMLDPEGNSMPIPTEKNISTGIIANLEGHFIVLPSAAEAGWRKMEDHCSPVEWRTWLAYQDFNAKHPGTRLTPEQTPKCIGTRAAPPVFVPPFDEADDESEPVPAFVPAAAPGERRRSLSSVTKDPDRSRADPPPDEV